MIHRTSSHRANLGKKHVFVLLVFLLVLLVMSFGGFLFGFLFSFFLFHIRGSGTTRTILQARSPVSRPCASGVFGMVHSASRKCQTNIFMQTKEQ